MLDGFSARMWIVSAAEEREIVLVGFQHYY